MEPRRITRATVVEWPFADDSEAADESISMAGGTEGRVPRDGAGGEDAASSSGPKEGLSSELSTADKLEKLARDQKLKKKNRHLLSFGAGGGKRARAGAGAALGDDDDDDDEDGAGAGVTSLAARRRAKRRKVGRSAVALDPESVSRSGGLASGDRQRAGGRVDGQGTAVSAGSVTSQAGPTS